MRLVWAALLCACSSAPEPTDARFTCPPVGSGDVLSFERTGQNWPKLTDLTFDANYIYWVNFDGHAVRRISKVGGVAETIATSDAPLSLTLDSTTIYVLDGIGALDSIAITGGPTSRLASATCPDGFYPCGWGIAIDDQTVYWGTDTQLFAKSKNAGTAVATDWFGYHTRAVALDTGYIYLARSLLGTDSVIHTTLERLPKSGGAPLTLMDLNDPHGSPLISAFVLNTEYVFVSEEMPATEDRARIWRLSKNGSERLDLGFLGSPAIAVDGNYLYLARGPSLERVSTAGGDPEPVACDVTMNVGKIAIDTDRIYWIDADGATIRSIVKPP